MLIEVAALQRFWGLHPDVVVHVGAHAGEELNDYERFGWGGIRTVWIEADEERAAALTQRLAGRAHHDVICAVAWDQSGQQIEFHELSNSQASSALPPKELHEVYPGFDEVRSTWRSTEMLENLLVDVPRIGLMNLDIQGAEWQALHGLGRRINDVDAIYCEVNTRELYEGTVQLRELDAWLRSEGFRMVDLRMESRRAGWGDGLWLRVDAMPSLPRLRRFARKASRLPSMTVYRVRVVGHAVRVWVSARRP